MLAQAASCCISRSFFCLYLQSLKHKSVGIICWHSQEPKGNLLFCLLLLSQIERGDHLMAPGSVCQRPVQAPMAAGAACFYICLRQMAFQPINFACLPWIYPTLTPLLWLPPLGFVPAVYKIYVHTAFLFIISLRGIRTCANFSPMILLANQHVSSYIKLPQPVPLMSSTGSSSVFLHPHSALISCLGCLQL